MSEPMTKSGRQVAAFTDSLYTTHERILSRAVVDMVSRSVRDAEREARAALLDELEAAVRGDLRTIVLDGKGFGTVHEPTRKAVLSLLQQHRETT